LIEGEISAETANVVERLLRGGQRISEVYLDSPGGSLHAGMRIGMAMYAAKVGTVVNRGAECQSACALAFLAGKNRYIVGDEGNFGFHRQYYIIDGKVRYGPWSKDVAAIDAYLKQIAVTSISASEIVGTTGQASFTQARLKDRGITTQSMAERVQLAYMTASPKTTYEAFRAACHYDFAAGLPPPTVCETTPPSLREPAIRIYAVASAALGETKRERVFKLLLGGSQYFLKGTSDEIFELDCRVSNATVSLASSLDLRLAEISLYVGTAELESYRQVMNALIARCESLLKRTGHDSGARSSSKP
jgi:ATP-dependent protease ClpP protease subunit